MGKHTLVGELEQMVLLAILQAGDGAHALAVRAELEARAARAVARGALYRTLDRLGDKGWVAWTEEDGPPERGGHPRRLYTVTPDGLQALRASRAALESLWAGLGQLTGGRR